MMSHAVNMESTAGQSQHGSEMTAQGHTTGPKPPVMRPTGGGWSQLPGWVHVSMRWALVIGCVLLIGPLAAWPLSQVQDVQGGHAITMLNSSSLVMSSVCGLLILGMSLCVGLLAARAFSLTVAFACAGLVMGWGAWRMGTLDGLVRVARPTGLAGDTSPQYVALLARLAIENFLVVLLVAAIAAALTRVADRTRHAHPAGGIPRWLNLLARGERGSSPARIALIAGSAAAAACLVVGFIAAATMLKGQAVFAAFLGAVAAGVVAQLVATGQRGSVSPGLVMLACGVPAAAGAVIAAALQGNQLLATTFAGTVVPIARIVSFDWACGLLLGVPVGMGWAGAMLDEHGLRGD